MKWLQKSNVGLKYKIRIGAHRNIFSPLMPNALIWERFISINSGFLIGWLIVALTCEVLSRLPLVFCLGMVFFTDILNLSSHRCDFSLYMADIYRAVSNVVTGPRPRREQPWVQATPICHERHLLGRVQCSHRATAVSNPTRSIMRSGNPICELLYEFTLHCWVT